MPVTVNIHYAKTHFSRLIQRIQLGEEIIIARAGEPLAQSKALSAQDQEDHGKHRHRLNIVNIHEAKTQLSQLLKQVEAGEEIMIAKSGLPVAKLSPLAAKAKVRQFGSGKDLIWMSPDFDEEDEALIKMFGA
jgi:prevent-host-death family protein